MSGYNRMFPAELIKTSQVLNTRRRTCQRECVPLYLCVCVCVYVCLFVLIYIYMNLWVHVYVCLCE